ncbi:MAG: hypothetical protein EOM59_11635 [Clostridia bacterium]|nr:hypothetical protein [Clostridia bacterium]
MIAYPNNLALAIAGEENIGRFLFSGLKEVLLFLTEKEQKVIKFRFEQIKTLAETSKEFGVCKERIRQIEAKALRKLRHPQYYKHYMGISLYDMGLKLNKKETEIRAEFEKHCAECKIHPQQIADKPKSKIDISDMDLSVRAYNCLIRANKRTISDLAVMSFNDFLKIRNLGHKTVDEVITKLKEYGIEIKEDENV